MAAPRKKTAQQELLEASEAGDNMAIYKAQRRLIIEMLAKQGLTVQEQVQLSTNLVRMTSEIVKLEGLQKKGDEELQAALAEDEELRS